jgi:large repetitive protein
MSGVLFLSFLLLLPQKQPRPSFASINGLVSNAITNTPIPTATIVLTPIDSGGVSRTVATDQAGHFSIKEVLPGRYIITATATLFVNPTRSNTQTVTAAAGQNLNDVTIQLAPSAVLSGRVYDQNQTPLRLIQVEAQRYEYRNGVLSLVRAGQAARTDDHGEYRIFDLPAGRYYLRATPAPDSSSVQAVPTYYPGFVDLENAVVIDLPAGIERGAVDFQLIPIKTYSVRLRIPGLSTDVRPTAIVVRRGSVAGTRVDVRIDSTANGIYRISRLWPGSYDVFIRSTPGSNETYGAVTAQTSINVVDSNDTEIDGGTLELHPVFAVRGTLLKSPSVGIDLSAVTVALRALDGSSFFASSRRPVNSLSEDGSFVITGVSSGLHRVEVSGLPRGVFLTSIIYANRNVPDATVVVDGQDPSLRLFLGGAETIGEVSGIVRDAKDEPVVNSVVVLVPPLQRRADPTAFKAVTTDQTGRFLAQGLLPGEYTVLAWKDIAPEEYLNPQSLRENERLGEKVLVEAGSRNIITARLISPKN